MLLRSCSCRSCSYVRASGGPVAPVNTRVLARVFTGAVGRPWCDRRRSGSREEHQMPTITSADGTEIFYKDWGTGQPIVFSHGWPLSADDWDTQMMFFLLHGYRVVAHD